MSRNGDIAHDTTPPAPTPRNAVPPGSLPLPPATPGETAAGEWGAAILREVEALRADHRRLEFAHERTAMAAQRAEATTLAMGPVLGRVDTELETLIANVDAIAPAVRNQAQALVDLRSDVNANARSIEALAVEVRGGFEGMRKAFERLASRVDGAEEKADATGKHFAPLVRAAADSMVDGVEARRLQRRSIWRIVVGVSLAIAGAGCSLLVQHCGGG